MFPIVVAALACAALVCVGVGMTPVWRMKHHGEFGRPRIGISGGISRSEFGAQSTNDLNALFGESRFGYPIQTLRHNTYRYDDEIQFGIPISFAFVYMPKRIGDGVCAVAVDDVLLKDTYVFPVGWRLSPKRMWPGPVTLYGRTSLSAGLDSCSSFRDFSHLFQAENNEVAVRGVGLASELVGPDKLPSSDYQLGCTVAVDASPNHQNTCDAASVLSAISMNWFKLVENDGHGHSCLASQYNDHLVFEDPNSVGYPIKTFDVFVCSSHTNGSSAFHITKVEVVRDDIA